MTKEQEFLNKLKHPNRDPIEKDIKRFLRDLIPSDIIETHVNRDKGSTIHTITITTETLGRFLPVDHVFGLCFPRNYPYGNSIVTNPAEGPDLSNHVFTFSKMYLIREYQ